MALDPILERKANITLGGQEGASGAAPAIGGGGADLLAVTPILPENKPLPVHIFGWPIGGKALGTAAEGTITQTLKSGGVAGVNDGATIYTVTTGKTFYCMGAQIGGAAAANMKLTANGTDFCNGRIAANGSVLYLAAGGVPIFSATGAITITGSGVGNNVGFIWGFEQ